MTVGKSSASLARSLPLLAVLFAIWLLWSGLFTPLLLCLGALSCLLTCYVTRRMDYFDNEVFALRINLRLIGYLGWLMREVLRSSLEVSRVVLDPRLPISPQIVEIDATALQAVDQAILGNSITLTPGALALDVHCGFIKVHSLTRENAEALISGEMARRVAALRAN